MTTERSAREIATEYKATSAALSGYEHHQDLDHEFASLHALENELFVQKRILEEPSLLLNLNLAISEGDGSEVIQGLVMGVEIHPTGALMAVILKGHPKPIPFNPETTQFKPAK